MVSIDSSVPSSDSFKSVSEIASAIKTTGKEGLAGARVCSSLQEGDNELIFKQVKLKGGGFGLATRITYHIETKNGKGTPIKGEQWVKVTTSDVATAKKAVMTYMNHSREALQKTIDEKEQLLDYQGFIGAKSFTYTEEGENSAKLSTKGLSETHTFTTDLSKLSNQLQKTIAKVQKLETKIILQNPPKVNESSPKSDQLKTHDEYKELEHKFEGPNGKLYGKDVITRENTFSKLTGYHEKKLDSLGDPKKLEGKELRDFKFSKNQIHQMKKQGLGKKYIGSQYFRDLISKVGFKEAIKQCVMGTINHREQVITTKDKTVSFARVGVMGDPRSSGFIDYDTLKAIESNPGAQETKDRVDVLLKELESLEKKATNKDQKDSISYLKSQLSSPEKIKTAVQTRQRVLQTQFLSLLGGHLTSRPGKVKDGKPLNIVHLALLKSNEVSSKKMKTGLDKTGWVKNETRMLKDMSAIFSEFDGKDIIFDEKGPFIKDGNIHFPRPKGVDKGIKKITLSCCCVNMGVQGSGSDCSNDKGVQHTVNQGSIPKLKAMGASDEMIKLMESGKTSYKSAADFFESLIDMDGPIMPSIGCLSAKDRTGAVAGFIAARKASGALPRDLPKGQRGKVEESFYESILNPKGNAVRVCEDSTGLSALKITAKLPVKNTRKLIAQQLGNLAKVGIDFVKKKLPSKKPPAAPAA